MNNIEEQKVNLKPNLPEPQVGIKKEEEKDAIFSRSHEMVVFFLTRMDEGRDP